MTQVAAIFRSSEGLQHAIRDLRAAGFDDAQIRVQHPDQLGSFDDLCRALVSAGVPESEARTHAQDLGVNDAIVEVVVPDDQHARWARRVLDAAGADRAHLFAGPGNVEIGEAEVASDPVDEASMGSFPASDPPSFNDGVARPRW